MSKRSSLTLSFFALLASVSRAQQLMWTFAGSNGDEYGAAVLRTGDQDNDGYPDLLVGAPGWNGGRGYVRCLSGKFLATGTGSPVVWTVLSTANAGARFGSSIAEVATLTGNSATDFVVGAPGFVNGTTTGAVFLVDGSTHTVATHIAGESNTRLGGVVVALGDQDGDGKIDIAANAIATSGSSPSKVIVIPGSSFGLSTNLTSVPHTTFNGGWHGYGTALASGFDYDGDGRFDLAMTIPDYGFTFPEAGYIEVRRPYDSGLIQAYTTNVAGEHFGASIDVSSDFDGDGVLDLVVGAPRFSSNGATENGHVRVLSGAQFIDPNLPGPIELYTLVGFTSLTFDFHFGASVKAGIDLNQDGVGDILVGAPDYTSPPSNVKGFAAAYSGSTGQRMAIAIGANTDALGGVVLGTLLDMNADGFPEFAAASSRSDESGTNSGTLKFFSLFPAAPASYCTGKTNSLGCTPAMSSSGTPSASLAAPFLVTCSNVINQKSGLLFYSHAPATTPFQDGTKCVGSPTLRTQVQDSGGSTSGSDCSGAFGYDFNARIASGIDPTLVAGSEVFTQYWSRDPASASTTSLSNGLRFVIHP